MNTNKEPLSHTKYLLQRIRFNGREAIRMIVIITIINNVVI